MCGYALLSHFGLTLKASKQQATPFPLSELPASDMLGVFPHLLSATDISGCRKSQCVHRTALCELGASFLKPRVCFSVDIGGSSTLPKTPSGLVHSLILIPSTPELRIIFCYLPHLPNFKSVTLLPNFIPAFGEPSIFIPFLCHVKAEATGHHFIYLFKQIFMLCL